MPLIPGLAEDGEREIICGADNEALV